LVREHSRALELVFETFARQWGTQLTAKIRTLSEVTCERVGMHSYDEYASSLPAQTAMVLCAIEGETSSAVVQFPTDAALGWVAHMFGATGEVTAPSRRFTDIEQALVRRLVGDALEDLRYSLGTLLPAPITVSAVHHNSQFAQAAAPGDLMIVASFAIRFGGTAAAATVALPAKLLLTQLGGGTGAAASADPRELIRTQLLNAPVDVTVRLAPALVRPGVILGLSVGDLLPIPHPSHRPLDVVVDGHPLARAAVGSNGSSLACVVVSSKEKS